MNKKQILEKLAEKDPIFADMKVEHADVMLMIFYINKLKEAGFIQGGADVTVKGFDLSMDLKEAGWRLSQKDIVDVIIGAEMTDTKEEALAMSMMVDELQEKGYEHMMKKKEEYDVYIKKEIEIIQNKKGVTFEEARKLFEEEIQKTYPTHKI